jgi:hypothetical protein
VKRTFALLLTVCLLLSTVGGVAAASSAPASDSISTTNMGAAENETQNGTETGTATGTETANNSTTETDEPSQTEANADLYVEQPRHVSSGVDSTTTEIGVVYTASGQVLELEPRNFNPEDVIKASVREDAATLKFDKSIGAVHPRHAGHRRHLPTRVPCARGWEDYHLPSHYQGPASGFRPPPSR